MKYNWTFGLALSFGAIAVPAGAQEYAASAKAAPDYYAAAGAGSDYAPQTMAQNVPCDSQCYCDSVCNSACCSPWTFTFTQTVDYGSNLVLPITLTPANTLIAPVGDPGSAAILNPGLVNDLGIADDLGLLPGPIANTPAIAVFPDDFQFQTTVGIQHRRQISSQGALTTGYTYYQSLHPEVNELDLNTHLVTAAYAHQLNDRLLGTVDYGYTYYYLDGDSFVSQNRIGASLLLNRNSCWDFQVRGDYADANFRPTPFLNSDNYSAKFEAIRYLGQRSDYLTFGYAIGYSNAAARSFSYQVNNVFVSGRWLYGACDDNELKLTFAYGIYDFFATDVIDTGVERQDDIFTFNVLTARQLSDFWTVFAAYTYIDSESNVARQNYDSSLISIGATYVR